MEQEKKHLPPVKELLEQMYGVKLGEPAPWTPEYREKVMHRMEEYAKEKANRRKKQESGHGPEDT